MIFSTITAHDFHSQQDRFDLTEIAVRLGVEAGGFHTVMIQLSSFPLTQKHVIDDYASVSIVEVTIGVVQSPPSISYLLRNDFQFIKLTSKALP